MDSDARQIVFASFDGACEPNNPGGAIGLGWVVNGVAHHEFLAAAPSNTNNMAEWRALLALLDTLLSDLNGPAAITITGDSELIVKQFYSSKPPAAHLEAYWSEARAKSAALEAKCCHVVVA